MKKIKIIHLLSLLACLLLSFDYNPQSTLNTADLVSRTEPETFYVDALDGSDSHEGTNSEKPWQSLDKISGTVFIPGDTIFFKAGSVWNGQLALKGSGTKDSPIVLDRYDLGNMPIINGGGALSNSAATLLLHNIAYWEINNLELTNTNGKKDYQGDLWGILGIKDDGGSADHIYIHNCYIHDVNGDVATKTTGGIYMTAAGSSPSWYDDLQIHNNLIENTGGLGIATNSPHANITAETRHPFLNLLISGNTVKNTGRNNMIVRVSDDAIVEHNRLINSSLFDSGHSVFCFNTDNIKIQYNEAYGNTGTGDMDRGGYDADYNCKNTKIQYNYSHDNFWGFGIMKRAVNENVVIRYNISENDQKAIYFYGFNSRKGMGRAAVYNNTHYVRAGLDVTVFGAEGFEREAFNTDFYNNIFFFEEKGSTWGKSNTNVNFENNCFYNIDPRGTNYITSDPQLASPGHGGQNIDWPNYPDVLTGYRLQPDSPCIDSGKSIEDNGGQDFWGNPINDGTSDIGAHEFAKGS